MILVSGATGMVGAHLLLRLLQKGEQVKAIKRKTSSLNTIEKVFRYNCENHEEFLQKIEWVELDITNTEAVFEVMKGVKSVYHAAAMVSFNDKNREHIIFNNVTATKNMVNAAIANDIEKFVHVSSSSALGDEENGKLVTENSERSPSKRHHGYSESKYLSEMEVWRGINENLNAVIVNPTVILGSGDWNTGSSNMFKAIANGLKFYPPGTNGYVDVLDLVDILIALMKSNISGERFIVSGHNLNYKEIFGKISRAFDLKEPNIKASPFMLGLAWRLEAVRCFIMRKEPMITKASTRSSRKLLKYSSKKLIKTLDFKYRKIEDTIDRITRNYKNISTFIE